MSILATELEWPEGTKFFEVQCRLGIWDVDGWDLDKEPEVKTLGGTVRITPRTPAGRIRLLEPDGKYRVVVAPPLTFAINEFTGKLVNTADNTEGVWVVDPASDTVDPKDFTYYAVVTPKVGSPFTVEFDGTVAINGVYDLANGTTVAPSRGVSVLESRITKLETEVGQIVREVSGTVTLTIADGPLVQVYATESATVNGESLIAGDVAVFRLVTGEWEVRVLDVDYAWRQVGSAPIPPGPAKPALSFTESVSDKLVTLAITERGADSVRVDWGDGQSSTSSPWTHTYADYGTYTVTVTATNAEGVTQVSRSVSVAAKTYAPGQMITSDGFAGDGPIEGRVTDVTFGGDQIAWRSAGSLVETSGGMLVGTTETDTAYAELHTGVAAVDVEFTFVSTSDVRPNAIVFFSSNVRVTLSAACVLRGIQSSSENLGSVKTGNTYRFQVREGEVRRLDPATGDVLSTWATTGDAPGPIKVNARSGSAFKDLKVRAL